MVSEPAPAPSPRLDLPDFIWRYSSSAAATIVLLGLLALTLALAAVFPQQPAGLAAAPAEYWLTTTAASYGALGATLRSLGFFNILNGMWVRLLLGVLAYHLLLRLAVAARHAWRARRGPGWRLPPAGLEPEAVDLAGPLDAAAERAQAVLAAQGFRATSAPEPDGAYRVLYAARRPLALWGPVLAYAGPLLILLGLLLDDALGWTASPIALAPGSVQAPPAAQGMLVSLEAISGPDQDPLATVLLQRPDGKAGRATVGHSRPAVWGGLWVTEQDTGPALAVSGRDAEGRPALLQSSSNEGQLGEEAHILFTDTQTEQAFADPVRAIAFRVVSYPALPERGIPETVFLVEAYRGTGTTPAVSQLVRGQGEIALDGVTYHLREERHAVLALAFVPGLVPLGLGLLVTLAGVVLSLWPGRVETWITLVGEGERAPALVRSLALLEAGVERARMAGSLAVDAEEPTP